MTLKGTYKLIYTIDKEHKELTVIVELKQIEGLVKPLQNVYYGIALVNGVIYNKKDLSCCVDAKLASESIGVDIKKDIIKKCRDDKKLFKLLKEDIK
jgi:hypothetical protein